ncbi:ThiF family adenylyltransferase [Rheinheimera sp. MMS21-TC3]|uniref:ThiF family adenylyltransferase n=1 Tax=Rheinheimera sp. MMS21-TC3 TaxID=3072790 RepID=UPI00391FA7B2
MTNAAFNYFNAFSRNIGWLTLAEQALLATKTVAIAGCGGVGGAHAVTLARLGVGRFHLSDFDSFEIENFNRQAGAKMSTLGESKLDTVVKMVLDINPEAYISTFSEGINEQNIEEFLSGVDVYIDGLDFFALKIRSLMFKKAYAAGVPAITAAPLGMGVSNLNFLPGKMTFEEYFLFDGASETEQYLRFFVGLSPARLHSAYLVVPESINLPERKGPSTIMACELCAGVAATQALKLMLNRGKVLAAPRCLQFDAYRNKYVVSWRPFGNANPINKLAIHLGKKHLLNQAPQAAAKVAPETDPLLYVLDKARWAPSGDNTQCWRFRRTGDLSFDILANDTRDHVVYDLNGFASNMSHGALLETIRLAATERGFIAQIIATDRSVPERPIYQLVLEPVSELKVEPLAAYIETRTVQRKPMGTRALSTAEKQQLEASLPAGFKVHWFETRAERWQFAKLMYGNAYTRLIMKEGYDVHSQIIDWNKKFSEDKIPEQALGVDVVTAKMMKWALKSWQRFEFLAKYMGGTIAPRVQLDFMTALRCSAHFVLYTTDETPLTLPHQVEAGKALQRFWLTATKLHFGFQPEQTPVLFSTYLRDGLAFSTNEKATENARKMDAKLQQLLPETVFKNKVFIGRIGRSEHPESRSIRLPLAKLMVE